MKRGRQADRYILNRKEKVIRFCCRLHPAGSAWFGDEGENKCTDCSRPVEKKGRYGTLLR